MIRASTLSKLILRMVLLLFGQGTWPVELLTSLMKPLVANWKTVQSTSQLDNRTVLHNKYCLNSGRNPILQICRYWLDTFFFQKTFVHFVHSTIK